MKEVADLPPEQEPAEGKIRHEQLWEIVCLICEQHGIPHKAEKGVPT